MAQHYSQTLRAFAAERSRGAFVAWSLCSVFTLAWMAWFMLASVTVYATSEQARLEVADAPSGVDVDAAGQVTSSRLVLGALVKKGDVLVELDSQRELLLKREEELRLAATAQKIEALRAEIAARQQALKDDAEAALQEAAAARARAAEARAAAEFAAGVAARTAGLAAKGVSPKAEAQKAAAEHRRLAAAADAAAAEVRRVDGEAKSRANDGRAGLERLNFDITALAGDYTGSQAAISRLSLEIERHVLRAPVQGRLADIVSLHPGSHVKEGQRLALVVPDGEVQVIAEFEPSPALGRVKAGQHAELRLDGFPWAQYGMLSATVKRIDSEVHDNKIRVELSLASGADGHAAVQHGLPGSVAVEIEQVTPAILLLRAAGLMMTSWGKTP